MRYADSTVGRRVAGRRPRAGGAKAKISTSKIRLRCLFRRCFFLVRAPVACQRPPRPRPAPPDHHCAGFLRSGAPGPACRTQTGRPGSRMCRDFAVRRDKNGVPPAKRTTWPPGGPIKHGRIGARDCDSSIVSAFSRSGASNPRERRQFRKRHLRICRKSPPRPRAGASNPRECCEFGKRHLRIYRKLPSRPPSGGSIPRYYRALRERTPPLARERSEGGSESTVICRAAGGRVPQITGPSALDARILDSVAIFGGVGTEAHFQR